MTNLAKILTLNGHRLRECWEAKDIVGTKWPSKVSLGHPLTLTNDAVKATTTKGLVMRGAELVTITDPAAISIADILTVVLPTFVLNTLFSSASAADMGIMNLNNGSVIAKLNSTTGALDITFDDADGGVDEVVSTTKVSWAKDTEWQVAFTYVKAAEASISVRLYINGVAENTNTHCDTDLTIPAGDTIYGYDGTVYLTGQITRGPKVWSTAALSAAQLLAVYNGINYPTNLVLNHILDEGRGTAVDDKATGATCDGVISGTNAATIWDYGGCKVPCMGVDGVNGYAVTAADVISLATPWTWVQVIRAMCTYAVAAGATEPHIALLYLDTTNRINISNTASTVGITASVKGANVGKLLTHTTAFAIGEYYTLMITLSEVGASSFFINGVLVDSDTAVGDMSSILGEISLSHVTAAAYGPDRHLAAALVDGVYSGKDAKQVAKDLNEYFRLGQAI